MEGITYEITNSDFSVLSAHYGFDTGYLDEDSVYKIDQSFIDKLQSQGILMDIEEQCQNLLGKQLSETLVDSHIHDYRANEMSELDYTVPFDKFYTYELHSEAVIDSSGDVIEVHYKKDPNKDDIAISEFRQHIRELTGQIPDEVYTLRRIVTVRFFRFDGTYTERIFDRYLNNYERKKLDTKSRRAVIDSVKGTTGDFIAQFYTDQVIGGQLAPEDAPSTIHAAATEALTMIEQLNDQISAYRDDRENAPLVNALNSYTRTTLLTDEIIQFITNSINIEYYTRLD